MRSAGILLHISSLPNDYGIGSMGKEAYDFVDFLARTGNKIWQILPTGPTSFGDSPYQAPSAFAFNHYFIDLDKLVEWGLLEEGELPTEYKIHVFNGKAKYLYVVTGRNKDIHYNNYLIDWTDFDEAQFNHWTKREEEITRPDNFDEAIKIAEKLAAPFPFVRVDLYIINKKIYISEMTFTPAKGTLTFKDDKSDYLIGSWLTIRR